MSSTTRNSLETKDVNWWLKLTISLIAVVTTVLAVGTAINDRPTSAQTRSVVSEAIKSHSEGSPPHPELRDIVEALTVLKIDIAVIKAAVVKSDKAADVATQAAANALARQRAQ